MTTTLLKISTLSAACSMVLVMARGQQPPDSQQGIINQNTPRMETPSPGGSPSGQNTRSWSTKHLSATGRDATPACRASKLDGAVVKDSSGNQAGVIKDLILDPVAGRVDFALVSLNENNGANGKIVPVPWALLKTSSGSSEYSTTSPEQCTFTLNADVNKLKSAPTVDWTNPSQSEWRQRIYAYYGVTPPPMGGAESPSGQMRGQGMRQLQPIPPPRPNP